MRYDYVVRLGTTVGNLYFKGGLERIADEASLTDALATLTSGQVPSTITTDYASGRWLYHELAGDLLIGSAFTEQMATAAVRALASLQKRALTGSAVEEHLSRRRMCALDLFARVNETIEESAETPDGDAERLDQWRRESARIAGTCARIDALGHPLTLVLSDFCGRNLLLTTGGIGFIDLEQSYWSHPWLSLWHFLHDVEQSGVMRNGARHRIARAFVSEWADIVPAGTMIQALTHLPTLGRLFGILLATRELAIQERELGEKLPARYRIKRLAPYIDRLLGCPTNLRSG
jgi:hypothetical protein